MRQVRLGVIGGTLLPQALKEGVKARVGTPYGPSPAITLVKFGGKEVAFIPRHGEKHSLPPHSVNYRANIWALHSLGVERVLATTSVGAIDVRYKSGEVAIPSDFIDFTKNRRQTFYDEAPVTHIDLSEPYCPELRELLAESAQGHFGKVWRDSVYLCTEGPRYETPAEVRMFRRLGCSLIGMTGLPELILARELEMCYASLCFVSNMAAGMQERLSAELIMGASRSITDALWGALESAVEHVPLKRSCLCSRTLEGSRV